jgi:hypothetical protein
MMAHNIYDDNDQYLLNKILELEDRIIELTNRLDFVCDIIDDKDNINSVDIKILEQYIRERKMRKINER